MPRVKKLMIGPVLQERSSCSGPMHEFILNGILRVFASSCTVK
jgi:hypothetical protein